MSNLEPPPDPHRRKRRSANSNAPPPSGPPVVRSVPSPSDPSLSNRSSASASAKRQSSSSAQGGSSAAGPSTGEQGPPNTRGHGKGRDIPRGEQLAIDFKRRNLVSMWKHGSAIVTQRDTDQVMSPDMAKQKLIPGAIISTSHHTGCSLSSNTETIRWDDPYMTATPYGVVYSKFRKFVVMWAHGTHINCIPIYTHMGKGSQNLDDHVAIRDSRSDTTAPPDPGDVHGYVVAEMVSARAADGTTKSPPTLSPTAALYVTNIVTLWKNIPMTYEGRLIASDIPRLKDIVLKHLG